MVEVFLKNITEQLHWKPPGPYSKELQFPSSMKVPGWKHTIDSMINFSMYRRCSRQIKAVWFFCRQRMKWEHFCARLEEDDRHAAAQVLRNM